MIEFDETIEREACMAHKDKKPGKGYTFAAYLTLPEDECWEIIDGQGRPISSWDSRAFARCSP